MLAASTPMLAQTRAVGSPDTYSQDDLKRVERARDDAQKRLRDLQKKGDKASREAADIDADLLAAANDSQRREQSAAASEIRLAQLGKQIETARASLAADQQGLEDLLAALMTMSAKRPPALTASPEAAGDAVRAAILMGEAAPALNARAKELKVKITTLNTAVDAERAERLRLTDEEKMIAARRDEIEALASEKRLARTSLASETAALEAETQRLAREADDLRGLLDSLAKTAPSAPGRKPAPGAKQIAGTKPQPAPATKPSASSSQSEAIAGLPTSGVGSAPRPQAGAGAPLVPVVGKNVRRFNEKVNGEPQSGLTISARSGAQVVAPLDARVEYAGVFRTYGQMLILDVGSGTLVILSGLDALYPEAGQWVLAGEPVGRMADQKSPSPELYLEVRRQGQPVDPERWLGRGA
jgi:septal ring factor EnvC (AmiA/AmiB activator)